MFKEWRADLKEVVREKPGLMSQADTTSKAGFLAGVDYFKKRKAAVRVYGTKE
jgi:hypothetical protein